MPRLASPGLFGVVLGSSNLAHILKHSCSLRSRDVKLISFYMLAVFSKVRRSDAGWKGLSSGRGGVNLGAVKGISI